MAVVVSGAVILVTLLFVQGKAAVALFKKVALPGLWGCWQLLSLLVFLPDPQFFVQRLSVKLSDVGYQYTRFWFGIKSYVLLKEHWLLGVGAHNWMITYLKSDLTGMFRTQTRHWFFYSRIMICCGFGANLDSRPGGFCGFVCSNDKGGI